MRQVFTSQRVETAEGVAQMLEDAGIATYVSNGRSYKGARRGRFSYSEPLPAAQQPAVWVRKADDQPRARQLLREAGLLDTTRPGVARSPLFAQAEAEPAGRRWALRIRLLLLALLAAAVVVTVLRYRAAQHAAEQAARARALQERQDVERIRLSPPGR
ncbi:MAG: pathogenicity-like protein [Pseudoxanthomonas sp.]